MTEAISATARLEGILRDKITDEPYFRGDGPLAVAERQIADERRRDAEYGDHPRPPAYWRDLPTATHRIRGGRAVCDGNLGSQCHSYPACDMHESWPCGCEYVQHSECWAIAWLDAVDLTDTAYDEALDRRDPDTLEWPDGEIEYEWDGDGVLWNYATDPEGQAA